LSVSASLTIRYDYIFRLVVVGDSGVGKSSLVNQFCHESFTFDLKSTIGVEFNVKTVEVNGKVRGGGGRGGTVWLVNT
jgi:GTPase SAR1 family protein